MEPFSQMPVSQPGAESLLDAAYGLINESDFESPFVLQSDAQGNVVKNQYYSVQTDTLPELSNSWSDPIYHSSPSPSYNDNVLIRSASLSNLRSLDEPYPGYLPLQDPSSNPMEYWHNPLAYRTGYPADIMVGSSNGADQNIHDTSLGSTSQNLWMGHNNLFSWNPRSYNRLPVHDPRSDFEEAMSVASRICYDHGCDGRVFSSRSNLRRHQRERARQTRQMPCPICGRRSTGLGHGISMSWEEGVEGRGPKFDASKHRNVMCLLSRQKTHGIRFRHFFRTMLSPTSRTITS